MELVVSRQRGFGPGGLKGRDDFIKDLDAREVQQTTIERLGHAREMGIPFEDLAKLQAAVMLAAPLDEPMEVTVHQLESFVKSWLGPGIAGPSPAIELAKDKGIGECPSADGNRCAAGFIKGRGGFGDRPDVAVGNDGNSLHDVREPMPGIARQWRSP